MSAVKLWVIRCDRCGFTEDATESTSAAGARRIARDEGWEHPIAHPGRSQMRIDVCATCAKDGS